jgi:sugar transferase (PEP-CTERM/EpsH1 system associated)
MAATPAERRNDSRLRVVHVVLQLNVGGMEKLLVEFARHADRNRIDLQFLCLGARGRLAEEIEACDWPVTSLEVPPGFRPGLVLKLAQLFRRWRADVVHTHNSKPMIYAAPAARLAGVAQVIHTRHGQRYQASWRGTMLFRLMSTMTDRVVCVSEDSAALSAGEGISTRRITTVRNGIDISRFSYRGPKADGPVVMVGRLSPEKDVETLVQAASLAVEQRPSFRMNIAGDGPCLEGLRRRASELGLDEQVRFLGDVRDVPELLAHASLFVLPSLTEGISLTLLEAMARGLPVVATRVGGNPEVVADGETGLLVGTRDPRALAEAMVRLLQAPEQGRQMGQAGRSRVERLFDVRRMVRDYEAHYLAGLDKSRSRSMAIARPRSMPIPLPTNEALT